MSILLGDSTLNFSLKDEVAKLKGTQKELATPKAAVGGDVNYNPASRKPFVMYTIGDPQNKLIWRVNPESCSWSLPIRATLQKNMIGTEFHVWPESNRKTHFDEMVLTMQLQVGNLIPQRNSSSNKNGSTSQSWNIAPGLENIYTFLNLLDAPKIVDARVNYVVIEYNSNVFPRLVLKGFFNPDSLEISESADQPASLQSFGISFTVMDTEPKMSTNQRQSILNSSLTTVYNSTRLKSMGV